MRKLHRAQCLDTHRWRQTETRMGRVDFQEGLLGDPRRAREFQGNTGGSGFVYVCTPTGSKHAREMSRQMQGDEGALALPIQPRRREQVQEAMSTNLSCTWTRGPRPKTAESRQVEGTAAVLKGVLKDEDPEWIVEMLDLPARDRLRRRV